LYRRILAHAADERRVVPRAFDRGDVPAVLSLVDQHDARGLAQDVLRLLRRNLVLELDVDRLGVTDEHRHAHAGRGDLDLRVEDLLGLDHHLPLFLGRAVVEEAVDVRDHVERDLLGELAGLDRVTDEDRPALLEQLVHPRLPGARDRLVRGDHHAPDLRHVVQRLQGHDHLRGRAVGVRDDVAVLVFVDRVGVNLGHDQRHVGVHAVERRVVDHHAAGRRRLGRVLLGRPRTRCEQCDVPAGKIEVLDIAALHHAPGIADLDFEALRARTGHGRDLIHRKLALGENRQHFAPDVPGGSYDCNPITHCDCPRSIRMKKGAPAGARAPFRNPWFRRRPSALLADRVAALGDAGALAGAAAQVIELGAADDAAADHLDAFDVRRVEREDALDALAEAHLANGEIAVDAAVGAGDADTLVVLDAGALTLDHAHADAHGVARAEFGDVLGLAESGDGFRFELLDQAHDGFL